MLNKRADPKGLTQTNMAWQPPQRMKMYLACGLTSSIMEEAGHRPNFFWWDLPRDSNRPTTSHEHR